MADSAKELKVQVKLDASGYLTALKVLEAESETRGKAIGKALTGAALTGLKALGQQVTNVVKAGAALGGSLALEGVKGGLQLHQQFRNFAFAVKNANGSVIEAAKLQRDAQLTAQQWGLSTQQLGGSYQALFEQMGDIDLARAGMGQVAIGARATGESVEALSGIVGALTDNFGVTGAEMPDAFAGAVALAYKSGVAFDQMGEKLADLGKIANAAGLQGKTGFETIAGMAGIASKAIGPRKGLEGVTGLAKQLGNADARVKLAKTFGVQSKEPLDLATLMEEIIKKTGGDRAKLAKGFSGSQLDAVSALGSVYKTNFDKESVGTVEERSAVAATAFRGTIKQAAGADREVLQKQATENMASDPQAKIGQALARLEESFSKPKLIQSVDQLAEKLPTVVDSLSKMVDFAAEHPMLAAGAVLGTQIVGPVLSTAIGALGKGTVVKTVAEAVGSGGAVEAGGGGAGLLAKLVGKLGPLGGATAAGLATDAYLSKKIDPKLSESHRSATQLEGAMIATEVGISGKVSPESLKQNLAGLRSALEIAKEDRNNYRDSQLVPGFPSLGGLFGKASDEDIQRGEALVSKGESMLERISPAAKESANALQELSERAREFFKAMPNTTPLDAHRGPRPPSTLQSGSEPRR